MRITKKHKETYLVLVGWKPTKVSYQKSPAWVKYYTPGLGFCSCSTINKAYNIEINNLCQNLR